MKEQTIVVIDDDDLFHILFTRILKSNNIYVTTYPNPSHYLCMQPGIETCPVAVACTTFLITDNRMPFMTGLEFLRRIKHMDCKIADCRKAIISGNWLDEELVEAKQLVPNVFHKADAKIQIPEWIDDVNRSKPST